MSVPTVPSSFGCRFLRQPWYSPPEMSNSVPSGFWFGTTKISRLSTNPVTVWSVP